MVLLFYTVVSMCMVGVFGEVSLIRDTGHANHPGFCYFTGPPPVFIKERMARKLPNGQCGTAKCMENFDLEIQTCEPPGNTRGCTRVPGNSRKPFPACCDRYICSGVVINTVK